MQKFLSKKLVTVKCARPFRIGNINYVGTINKVVLDVNIISKCLEAKARVIEHLANGTQLPLNFNNYNIDNGGSIIYDDNQQMNLNTGHKITIIGANGKKVKEVETNPVKPKKEPLKYQPKILDTNEAKQEESVKEEQKVVEEKKEEFKVETKVSTSLIENKNEELTIIPKFQTNVTLEEKQENKKKDQFDYNNNYSSNKENKKKNKY